jgi:CRP/FNR family cyclic AMP-dependent transcriptional regulator
VLLRQGDDATRHAYVLWHVKQRGSACVKITARLPNGTEGLLGIRLCGDVVGELAALHGSPRSATAITCQEVGAQVIQSSDFKAFLGKHQDAWLAVSQMIADQLEWANQRRLDYTGYPVAVRLARILVSLADRHGNRSRTGLELGVTLSQDEIGRLIGARRDAVGQAVAKLKQRGFIATSYRTVTITDLDGLRALADSNP